MSFFFGTLYMSRYQSVKTHSQGRFTSIWDRNQECSFHIYGAFFTYTPGTPPYEPLAQPARVPRMWVVERDPRASLGRRGARGDGLVVVFWASLVVATESPRVAVGHPVGREGVPRECMTSHARPWASHACGLSRGIMGHL